MTTDEGVMKYLDVSTVHLTYQDTCIMDECLDDPNFHMIVYKYPEGYWISTAILDDPDMAEHTQQEWNISKHLFNVLEKARQLECWFARFDADGNVYEDLPQVYHERRSHGRG